MKLLTMVFFLAAFVSTAAQADDPPNPKPRVGRQAAAKYFQRRTAAADDEQGSGPSAYATPASGTSSSSSNSTGSAEHYLALHFGEFTSSQAYDWGSSSVEKNVGQFTSGLTYRVGEWKNSMDLNLRLDFIQYHVDGPGEPYPLKMSILPMITLPDVSSHFPLYFGLGAGPGIFFRQLDGKGPLTFDYELVAGARFFNVFENTGFFLEAGLKNHLELWNLGQFNGTFLAAGAIFTF